MVNLDFLEKHFLEIQEQSWKLLFPRILFVRRHVTQFSVIYSWPSEAFLAQKHHIYLLESGRINVCGITLANVDHIGRAIHDAVTSANAHL